MDRLKRIAISTVLALLLIALGVALVNLGYVIRARRLPRVGSSRVLVLTDSVRARADTLPLDSARVIAALRQVEDPELGFNIVALGLVKSLRLDSLGDVQLTMILTIAECPYVQLLGEQALAALKTVPGVRGIEVRLDTSQPWDPSSLTGAARKSYERLFGHDGDSAK